MAGKSEAVPVVVKSDPPGMGGDIWRRKCQRLKRKCEEFEQVSNRGNFTKSSIIGWRYLARCELFMVLLTLVLPLISSISGGICFYQFCVHFSIS